MKSNWIEDLTLAQKVAAGDETALDNLFQCYADMLFAFIFHHLNQSHSDAEDVWQETLLGALRTLPGYQGQSRLFTWLCGIARHKIADHLRRQGRDPTEAFSDVPEAKLSSLINSASLPEEFVLRQAGRIRIVEALGMLPKDYQSALVMRYADEQSVDEVARMLQRTYKATESLLSRARVAFQEALAHLEGHST